MGAFGQFANPLAGGIGTLIRAWLRSVNYVAGLTGWQITKAGDAEFNSATIRGELDVTGSGGSYIRVFNSVGTPVEYFNPAPPPSAAVIAAPSALFASTSAYATGYTTYVRLSSPIFTGKAAARITLAAETDDASADPVITLESNNGAHPLSLLVRGTTFLESPGDLITDGHITVGTDLSVAGAATVTGDLSCRGQLVPLGLVGGAGSTSNSAAIGTVTETVVLTSGSVDFLTGHVYRLAWGPNLQLSAAGRTNVRIRKTNAAGQLLTLFLPESQSAGSTLAAGGECYLTNTSGATITAALALTLQSISGTTTQIGSATSPRFLSITDCGPANAAAVSISVALV